MNQPLLATAVVKVCSNNGFEILARALIDQCSQASFITTSLFKKLHLKKQTAQLPVSGIGGKSDLVCSHMVNFDVKPHFYSDFTIDVEAFILPTISSYSPNLNINIQNFDHIKNLQLADPSFNKKGRIDLLLSTSCHASLIKGDIRRGKEYEPIATSSNLGWIISGNSGKGSNSCVLIADLHDISDVSFNLERFWQQEEISISPRALLTPDEQAYEDYFVNTHSRNSDGQYIVRLPFKNLDTKNLKFNGSFQHAKRVFDKMEAHFKSNPGFAQAYHKFMRDYESLGHMEPSSAILSFMLYYFLPHHGILGQNRKFRSVFNGSAKDYDKISINDLLHCGGNLLPDLAELIINWMKYQFVFVSDIEHMFRQILVHPDDRKFQQILWRYSDSENLQSWSLKTVTYGMISSPYLANRVIRQLALDEGHRFPLAVNILKNETYMDDTLSGGHSLAEALQKQSDLIQICKVGGFSLHKWMANTPELLNFPVSIRAETKLANSCFNLLGLNWCPNTDHFTFDFSLDNLKPELTRRQVLSSIAKLFDPLGCLAPVVITAKIFLQKLWREKNPKLEWDTKLPASLRDEFKNWYNTLNEIKTIKIKRWIKYVPEAKYELYGFADASELAYGACTYLKITHNGKSNIHLIQAKSKVAPIKPILTIPKLELNAAHLLVKLTVKVLRALKLDSVSIYLHTDSTDVLYWLKEHPSKWERFVKHRCSAIHTLLPEAFWCHVKSKHNPADCISRGLPPVQLQDFSLWWEGGVMVKEPINLDNSILSKSVNLLNVDCHIASSKKKSEIVLWNLVDKYSSLQKLLRITAYVLRFIDKIYTKSKIKLKQKSCLLNNLWFKVKYYRGFSELVSVPELVRARLTWIYLVQNSYFSTDINLLKNNQKLDDLNLRRLDPFFDQNLLRLGGRIHFALLDYDQKHPWILPSKCTFSKLLVDYIHEKTLHGGVRLTLSSLRQQF